MSDRIFEATASDGSLTPTKISCVAVRAKSAYKNLEDCQ